MVLAEGQNHKSLSKPNFSQHNQHEAASNNQAFLGHATLISAGLPGAGPSHSVQGTKEKAPQFQSTHLGKRLHEPTIRTADQGSREPWQTRARTTSREEVHLEVIVPILRWVERAPGLTLRRCCSKAAVNRHSGARYHLGQPPLQAGCCSSAS